MKFRQVTYILAGSFTQLVFAEEVGPTGEILGGILDINQVSPVSHCNVSPIARKSPGIAEAGSEMRFFNGTGGVSGIVYLRTLAVMTRISALSLKPAVPTMTFSPSRNFMSL